MRCYFLFTFYGLSAHNKKAGTELFRACANRLETFYILGRFSGNQAAVSLAFDTLATRLLAQALTSTSLNGLI